MAAKDKTGEVFGLFVPLILNPDQVGETHWTALKLHGHFSKECQEDLGYSTLLRYLKEHMLYTAIRANSLRDKMKRSSKNYILI